MRLLDATGDAELTWEGVADHLASQGLVLIRQGSVGAVQALLAGWTGPATHPHDNHPGLTVITPDRRGRGTADNAGFTRSPLLPHTDRSLQPEPPSVLAAVMISPSAIGGQTLLADGAGVLTALRYSHPPAVVDHLCLRTANGETAPIITIRAGLVKIRFRDDQMAAPWSAGGDQRVVATLRDSISAATTSLPLSAGDGYLLHNHRYLHGRSGFAGHRQVARMLAMVTRDRLTWLNHGFRVADA